MDFRISYVNIRTCFFYPIWTIHQRLMIT